MHAHLFNHVMPAVSFRTRPAAAICMSNYHWQVAVTGILHPDVRSSVMEPCWQAVLFLLPASFDVVKLSASKINFLKLLKMPKVFNFFFSNVMFCFIFASSLTCHPSNHSKQCQHQHAWQAGQGRAEQGRTKGFEERAAMRHRERRQEKAASETVSPHLLAG